MTFDGIAHDLKTPLATLLGTARLIGAENLSPAIRLRLAVIEAQVERMRLLIDSYLASETAGERIAEEHAGEIVAEAARELEPLLQRAGVTLQLHLDDDLPRCRCARHALHRVVVNVVKNAIDATPSGGAILCRLGARGGNDIVIEITDTGVGMPADVVARVFERGFTTKASSHGHGLGLAISRDLMRGQGGDISISSQAGHGTRVTLILPAASARVVE